MCECAAIANRKQYQYCDDRQLNTVVIISVELNLRLVSVMFDAFDRLREAGSTGGSSRGVEALNIANLPDDGSHFPHQHGERSTR